MKNLLYSRTFLFGLLLRLLFIPFFGSTYLKGLFIPFIDHAVLNPFTNPWSQFPEHFFPYGSVLFILLFVPKIISFHLFGKIALGTGFLSLSLMKLPLLVFDFLLLQALVDFAPQRRTQLLRFYWLNPIVLYISYIHGQLDVVSMTFCFISILYLVQNRIFLSSLSFAAATLCKTHVLIIVPFMMVYIWNWRFSKQAMKDIVTWLLVFTTGVIIGFIPLLLAKQFSYVTTSSPQALRLFAAQLRFGTQQSLYLGLLLTLLVLGRLCVSRRISQNGLVFGCGVIFGTLLLVTDAMPGWYYWIVPFESLLFAIYLNVPEGLYWVISLLYLIYFGLLQGDRGIFGNLTSGIGFTLLETSLIGLLLAMWFLVVQFEAILQGNARPVILGLSGDSGAGKNYLSSILEDLFHSRSTLIMEGDDYHKWERNNEKWNDYTHLNPRANYLDQMAVHASQLAMGKSILKAHYDHRSGSFTALRELKPSKTVIMQGLHTFYLRNMREEIDLKIFLSPHPLVRLFWKIKRDAGERGYSVEKVLESLALRESDEKTHIEPQNKFADWIIEFLPTHNVTKDDILKGLNPELILHCVLWNDAPITEILEALERLKPESITYDTHSTDINRISLTIKTEPSAEEIENIGNTLFPNIRHITRGWNPPIWRGGYDGILQLITLALLGSKTLDYHKGV